MGIRYLGSMVAQPDGSRRFAAYRMPPPPARAGEDRVAVPHSALRAIANGRGLLVRVLGDGMQPGILDNDLAVVLHHPEPRNGDVVLVRTGRSHPVYGEGVGCLWRYRDGFLSKDDRCFRAQQPVTPDEIIGVVTRALPRERRNPLENYARIHECRAIESLLGITSDDLGFHRDSKRDEISALVSIRPSELVDGRLPWGLFRATTNADYSHAGIHSGDTLTIHLTQSAHVGQLVIEQLPDGQIVVGLLQRERLQTGEPGEFFIDVPERIYTTQNGGLPLGRTLAVIEGKELGNRFACLPLRRQPHPHPPGPLHRRLRLPDQGA